MFFTSNVKKISHLQIDIFCYFGFCHCRRNAFGINILACQPNLEIAIYVLKQLKTKAKLGIVCPPDCIFWQPQAITCLIKLLINPSHIFFFLARVTPFQLSFVSNADEETVGVAPDTNEAIAFTTTGVDGTAGAGGFIGFSLAFEQVPCA